MGGDLGLDPKTIRVANSIARNLMFTLMSLTLFIGACMLCSSGATAGKDMLVNGGYVFGAIGFALMVYVFVTIKNDK